MHIFKQPDLQLLFMDICSATAIIISSCPLNRSNVRNYRYVLLFRHLSEGPVFQIFILNQSPVMW